MSPLRVEVFVEDTWADLDTITTADRWGSMSSNHAYGRDVYIFGIDPVENHGLIKKLPVGVDVEIGRDRLVSPVGTMVVATLTNGQSHEMSVKTDKSPLPRRIRFTYLNDQKLLNSDCT